MSEVDDYDDDDDDDSDDLPISWILPIVRAERRTKCNAEYGRISNSRREKLQSRR